MVKVMTDDLNVAGTFSQTACGWEHGQTGGWEELTVEGVALQSSSCFCLAVVTIEIDT